MATYTKETALYDTGAISSDIQEAGQTASAYMTDISQNGVFVHEYDTTNPQPTTAGANGVHISDDVDVIRDGKVVASYGEDAVVGEEGKSQIVMSSTDISGVTADGYTSFSISGNGASESTNVISEKDFPPWTSRTCNMLNQLQTGSTFRFGLGTKKGNYSNFVTLTKGTAAVKTVTKSGVQYSYRYDGGKGFVRTDSQSTTLYFICEATITVQTPVFTFGTRKSDETEGAYSLTVGRNNVASGQNSVALIRNAIASSNNSIAIGDGATASGSYSTAIGVVATASGAWSTAIGRGAKASHSEQMAVGVYNEDNSDTVFEVGIGDGNNYRRNAFQVYSDGAINVRGGIYTINKNYLPLGSLVRGVMSADKSAASGSWVSLGCSVTLDEGLWLITCGVRWPSNSNGRRGANCSTTAGDNSNEINAMAVSGIGNQLRWVKVVQTLGMETTYYLNSYHNAGTTLTIAKTGEGYGNYIDAIKIW